MSQTIAAPFQQMAPPRWADGFGQDEFGYWASFSVSTGDKYWDFVSQRMRWIPPGTFMMGSPDDEPERWAEAESPQHEVTLQHGFWLGETACTQELWDAVMAANPSQFVDPKSPVENVSWSNAQAFFEGVTELVSGLSLQLPTEAQWEYACRTGTTTPFHFGETVTSGEVNFDCNYPYNDGPKGEYRQTTVPVKTFPPNDWGLYEMHGNVWEWCADWWDENYYKNLPSVDPSGPEEGSSHVIRGGGWSNFARYVRSACRNGSHPGARFNDLGFRCMSSASPAPSK